jgi:hypothetical protein
MENRPPAISALGNIFPCDNCPIPLSYKYPDYFIKIDDSKDLLLVMEEGKLIHQHAIEKMTPGCRFCKGLYLHRIGQLNSSNPAVIIPEA